MVQTIEEKRAYVKKTIAPYSEYLMRGYAHDVMKILEERGIKNEFGMPYTLDQIRHTRVGKLAWPELADVIAEVGRRNKEAKEKAVEVPLPPKIRHTKGKNTNKITT